MHGYLATCLKGCLLLLTFSLIGTGSANDAAIASWCAQAKLQGNVSSLLTAICSQMGPLTTLSLNASQAGFGTQVMAFLVRYLYTDKAMTFPFRGISFNTSGSIFSVDEYQRLELPPPTRVFTANMSDFSSIFSNLQQSITSTNNNHASVLARVSSLESMQSSYNYSRLQQDVSVNSLTTIFLSQKASLLENKLDELENKLGEVISNISRQSTVSPPRTTSFATIPPPTTTVIPESTNNAALTADEVQAVRFFFAPALVPLSNNDSAKNESLSNSTSQSLTGRKKRHIQKNNETNSSDYWDFQHMVEVDSKSTCAQIGGIFMGRTYRQYRHTARKTTNTSLNGKDRVMRTFSCYVPHYPEEHATPTSYVRKKRGITYTNPPNISLPVNITGVSLGLITIDEREQLNLGGWLLANSVVVIMALLLGSVFLNAVGYKALAHVSEFLGLKSLARRFYHMTSPQIILDATPVHIVNQPDLMAGCPQDWDVLTDDDHSALICASYQVDCMAANVPGGGLRGHSIIKPVIDVGIAILRVSPEEWGPLVKGFRVKPCADPLNVQWFDPLSAVSSSLLNKYSDKYFSTYKIKEALTTAANELGMHSMADCAEKLIPLIPSIEVYNFTGFRKYSDLTLINIQILSGHYHIARMLTPQFVLTHPESHLRVSASKFMRQPSCPPGCCSQGCCSDLHMLDVADYINDMNSTAAAGTNTLGNFNHGIGFGNTGTGLNSSMQATDIPKMHALGGLTKSLLAGIDKLRKRNYAPRPKGFESIQSGVGGNQYISSKLFASTKI